LGGTTIPYFWPLEEGFLARGASLKGDGEETTTRRVVYCNRDKISTSKKEFNKSHSPKKKGHFKNKSEKKIKKTEQTQVSRTGESGGKKKR